MGPTRLAQLCALALALGGCHRLLPFVSQSSVDRGGADLEDGRPADLPAPRDRQRAEGLDGGPRDALDARGADAPVPCATEAFSGPLGGWQATVGEGSWTWWQLSSAKQSETSTLHAFLSLLDPAQRHLGSAVLSTTLTVDALLQNQFSHGAGIALLVSPGKAAGYPHRQVGCAVIQSPTSGEAQLYMLYYDGTMDVAQAYAAKPLSQPILGRTVTLELRLTTAPAGRTLECTLPQEATLQDSAKVTALVNAPPLGFALSTYTAAARFDEVSLCSP